ncbi:hypothetical protein Tco_1542988, partial [Tanacetum coccineum]
MDFRSFMMEGVDGEFNFLPEGGLDEEGNSPSTRSVNDETSTIDAEPITDIHPLEFAKNIGNSDDAPSERDEMTLIGRSKLQNPRTAILTFMVVAHVTPLLWKQHLKEISLEKLCDIHDRSYMRQVVLDNTEVAKDKAYAELERKCNKALQDLEKNALVLDMRSEMRLFKHLESEKEQLKSSKVKLLQEIDSLRQDKAAVVSKVIPHVATKLARSDEIGLLVARLVKAAMFHNRCIAFEEVAYFKEPFILEKIPSYRPSSGKGFDQAGDDLATASYPFITKAIRMLLWNNCS